MKKDQCVIACLPSPEDAQSVLPYARLCATQLGKRLVLLNVSHDGQSEWLKDYDLPYIGLNGEWKPAIDGLPTTLGGVLMLAPLSPKAPRSALAHPATLLRNFAYCKTAYIAVPSDTRPQPPRHVALSIDHRRESKEKLIWGSYFVRFFGSTLTVACPSYRDAGLLRQQANNMQFLDKMYRSLGVDYNKATIPQSTATSPDLSALRVLAPDLLIALATDRRDRDLGDWLFGSPELRLLKLPSIPPILLLNQRDDLYVLCD